MIVLSETNLSNIFDSELFCDNYTVYRQDRNPSTSVKITALFSKYSSSVVNVSKNQCEIIFVYINLGQHPYIIRARRIPPSLHTP